MADGTGTGGRDPVAEAALDDGLDRRWTPHRMAYIRGENKPNHTEAGADCPFCRIPAMSDEEGLVVARGASVYAVPPLADSRSRAQVQLSELDASHKRFLNPHTYKVGLERGLSERRLSLIAQARVIERE